MEEEVRERCSNFEKSKKNDSNSGIFSLTSIKRAIGNILGNGGR